MREFFACMKLWQCERNLQFIFCRCMNEFKIIYEYSLFTFFVWTLLSVCSILLTVQLQLVEYSFLFLIKKRKNQKSQTQKINKKTSQGENGLVDLTSRIVLTWFSTLLCFFFWYFKIFLFKGGKKSKSNWNYYYITFGHLDIWIYIFHLWAWRNGSLSFSKIQRWTLSIRMEFISNWSATNLFDIFIGNTTANYHQKLWKHFVHTWHIQTGKILIWFG